MIQHPGTTTPSRCQESTLESYPSDANPDDPSLYEALDAGGVLPLPSPLVCSSPTPSRAPPPLQAPDRSPRRGTFTHPHQSIELDSKSLDLRLVTAALWTGPTMLAAYLDTGLGA
ncbi:hypothetical protein [Nannocystis pusilla]|uniref:hypothetical protein n=1 Tax=Nannocystis pusilla TaxID=889268 RepID=UPI003B813C91